ncbi:MAG: undecaprenyldiphospho-muramoylpentapeptide beta-N-acetylglucosaminyltransferase, partial [Bacteroidales bacterium]|nr:undecaprenyldiphospho-muramoylpentapeptide beta-N-acetylglucosaminyltransferase [Bacteroidales bacterium]
MEYKALRVIISGGGTGGHIFPAISIANKLKELNPDTEILFVGAEGKMEMEKVPAAGYKIVGLPILGLQRQLNLHNIVNDLKVPFKVFQSVREAGRILDEFKPDIAIGVGGYASAPLLWQATRKGIPSLIQEQNGFAGLTNKIVGKKAGCICVAYEGMERFFPADKIVMSGNPIRSDIVPATAQMVLEGMEYYGLDPQKDHLLIVGGSLGSGTLNKAMKHWIEQGCPGGDNVEIIWQCGKYYKKGIEAFMAGRNLPFIHFTDFIGRMDYAYAVADVVISRSGASTVSELCAAHKASIFVPSPNVAEDHQTHNAMALVNKDAALMVRDAEAPEQLLPTALALLRDEARIQQLEANIAKLALTNAAQVIADEAYKLVLGSAGAPSDSLAGTREYAPSPKAAPAKEDGSSVERAYPLFSANEMEGPSYKRVYFIGIGGIGMSAIARYYKFKGLEVSGYDRTPSDLTKELEAEGIAVHYEDRPDLVPAEKEGTLVVYTPAIPDDMGELVFVRENGYRLVTRSRVLGEIARGQRCLAVAGTHGKTTTSTLAAHILTASGEGCSAFLGGISKNYNTNLLTSKTPTVVAEADEFDRSFLQLFPEVAVVTAMDPDHLDIYGTEEAYRQAFKDFAAQVSGTLIAKLGLPLTAQDTP